jgi:hypothetical protein
MLAISDGLQQSRFRKSELFDKQTLLRGIDKIADWLDTIVRFNNQMGNHNRQILRENSYANQAKRKVSALDGAFSFLQPHSRT